MKMEAMKIWVRFRWCIAGVEQALRVGHHRPVDLEQVGKEDAQHTGDQQMPRKEPDTAAQHRRSKPYTRAMINMVRKRVMASPTQMGFQPLQVEGAPAPSTGMSTVSTKEAMARTPVRPANRMRKQGKAGGHQGLPAQAVVVAHGDIGDGVPVVAHHHLGPVSRERRACPAPESR